MPRRKSAKQKVFRYLMGLHFGICHGPVDRFMRFLAGDREAWIGSATGNETITVSAPELFGGNSGEGGIDGKLTVMMGGPAQMLPGNVAVALPAQAPAFRGVLSLFYDGLISVNNPYVKPMAFQVERIKQGWAGGGCWYEEKAAIVVAVPDAPAITSGFLSVAEYAFGSVTVPEADSTNTSHPSWEANFAQTIGVGGFRYHAGAPSTIADPAITTTVDFDPAWTLELRAEIVDAPSSGSNDYNALYELLNAAGAVVFTIRIQKNASRSLRVFYGTNPSALTDAGAEGTPSVVFGDLSFTSAGVAFAKKAIGGGFKRVESWTGSAPLASVKKLRFTTGPNTFHPGYYEGGGWLKVIARDSTVGDVLGMNGAHIIYQCLTDPQWGMGYPAAAIGDASFTAAADALYAEGLGLCVLWNTIDEIGAFCGKVLDHIGGVLYTDPQTGKFKLTLLRADYDPATLPVFDESNIVALESFQRVGYGDTVNEIVVVYRDVATNKDASVTVQNLANIQAQGGVVSQTRQYPGLPTESLALRVAQRDLDASSIPLAKARIKVNRKGWDRTPGSCIKLTWPKLGIAAVVMRVLDIDTGTLEDGAITINCAEDVFGLPASTYAEQEPPGWVPPSTEPQPIARQAMMEAPYYLLAHNLPDSDLAALDADASYFSALAVRPTTLSLGFAIHSRVGAAAYAQSGSGLFVAGAELAGGLEQEATSTIALANPADLDSVSAGMLAVVGEGRTAEIMQLLTIDTGTNTITVNRGVLDTTPHAHAAGAKVFFITGDETSSDTTERATAETIDYKLLPQTTGAQLDPSLATPMTVTADQRQARPLAPGNLQVNGVMFPASVTGAINVTWAHRDRLQQTAGIVLQIDGSVGPEPGTTYDCRVYDDDTNALLSQSLGVAGTSWPVLVAGGDSLRVEVSAKRGGVDSWQRQVRRFSRVDGLVLLENGDVLNMEPGQLVRQECVPPDTSGFAHRATFALSGTHSAKDKLVFLLYFNSRNEYFYVNAAGTTTLAEYAQVIAAEFAARVGWAAVEGDSVHVYSSVPFLGVLVYSAWPSGPIANVRQEAAPPAIGGLQWTWVDLYATNGAVPCPDFAPDLATNGTARVAIDIAPRRYGGAPIAGGGGALVPGSPTLRRFYVMWQTTKLSSHYLNQISGLADEINGDAFFAANGISASLGLFVPPPPADAPMARAAVQIYASGDYKVSIPGTYQGFMQEASHPSGYKLVIGQSHDLGPAIPSGLPQICTFSPVPNAGEVIEAGQQWWLTLDGTEYHYTLTGSDTSGADVTAGLAALVNPGGNWTVAWGADAFGRGQTSVTATAANTPFTCGVWASYGVRVTATIDS